MCVSFLAWAASIYTSFISHTWVTFCVILSILFRVLHRTFYHVTVNAYQGLDWDGFARYSSKSYKHRLDWFYYYALNLTRLRLTLAYLWQFNNFYLLSHNVYYSYYSMDNTHNKRALIAKENYDPIEFGQTTINHHKE